MGLYKVCLLTILTLLSGVGVALENYRAVYDISVRGVGAGKVSYEVIFTDVTYRVDTKAIPSLAAKMLGFGEIVESAYGEMRNGVVLPQRYQRSMDGDSDYRLIYNYPKNSKTIEAQIGNDSLTLDYEGETQPLDILSLIVQSLSDRSRGQVAKQYALLSDENIRTYTVKQLPDEIWQTPQGEDITINVYVQSSGERHTKIYFAQNPLRLVRLTQYKNNDSRFGLRLLDYQTLQ